MKVKEKSKAIWSLASLRLRCPNCGGLIKLRLFHVVPEACLLCGKVGLQRAN